MAKRKYWIGLGAAMMVVVTAALVVLIVTLLSGTDETREGMKEVNGVALGPQAREIYQEVKDNARDDQAGDVHAALKNEAPPSSPLFQDPVAQAEATIRAQEEAIEGTRGPDEVEDPQTLAEPEQRGCRSGPFVGNKSSRNGARPSMGIAHRTVSHNVPGWGDVNAIVSWFNNSRSQASSTYVIDAEGNCAYIVNEAFKPWTQGFFNPWSISIEFIHYGNTSAEKWTDKQIRKGALVFADASKRWGIPRKLVNPSGCNVVAGFSDHDRLECGNSHTDVGSTFPMKKFVSLINYYAWPSCTVRNVKKRLNAALNPARPLVISNTFTARAKRFVVRFQNRKGLVADGVVRSSTGWALHLRGCNGSIR